MIHDQDQLPFIHCRMVNAGNAGVGTGSQRPVSRHDLSGRGQCALWGGMHQGDRDWATLGEKDGLVDMGAAARGDALPESAAAPPFGPCGNIMLWKARKSRGASGPAELKSWLAGRPLGSAKAKAVSPPWSGALM